MGRSDRHTMTSGWIPIDRSSFTECWVGLVLSSPVGPMKGISETWTNATFSRPTSLRSWRMASRNGRLSMSPTVPPTSITQMSASVVLAEVEICLRSVVENEDLPVLERVHRARVDVDVGIELLEGDPETTGLEEAGQGSRGDALPEAGGDSSRDEHVLRSLWHYGIRW